MRSTAIIKALLSLFLLSTAAWSQAITGSISGAVIDKSGASIAAVGIVLVNSATGAQRTVQSNDAGLFVFSSVDPGEYSLLVQAPGFKTLQQTGIRVSPSEILSVGNLSL